MGRDLRHHGSRQLGAVPVRIFGAALLLVPVRVQSLGDSALCWAGDERDLPIGAFGVIALLGRVGSAELDEIEAEAAQVAIDAVCILAGAF